MAVFHRPEQLGVDGQNGQIRGKGFLSGCSSLQLLHGLDGRAEIPVTAERHPLRKPQSGRGAGIPGGIAHTEDVVSDFQTGLRSLFVVAG